MVRSSHNKKYFPNSRIGKYTLVSHVRNTDAGSSYWICRCDCGRERELSIYHLHENSRCEVCRIDFRLSKFYVRYPDAIGKRFGKWIVLELVGFDKYNNYQVRCECQCYWKTITVIEYGQLRKCKTSSCMRCCNPNKYYEEMSGGFWRTAQYGAELRNLEFLISKEYAWNLFIKQERKCALSGINLVFSPLAESRDGTASLDRIDSSKGYIEGNVQWVHKHVNIMKQDMSDQEFIGWCKMIAEYNYEKS